MVSLIRGIAAGLGATIALSILMMAKGMMGLMPELNVIAMLGNMAQDMMNIGGMAVGWALHFMIGAVIFGALFHQFNDKLPGDSQVKKGLVFGVGAWLVMMVGVMPMAGAGMFGMALGMMAPVMTLMLHLIYGAVLGFAYNRLAPAGGEAGSGASAED